MDTLAPEQSKTDPQQLLLQALEARWKRYRVELKRCRAEFSNEAVHDLRSATRRMHALIQLLNSISARPRLQRLTRAFKEHLDEFDELRDTQVILAELSEIIGELPQLQEFQRHLRLAEEKMLRTLRKRFKRRETTEMTRRIRKTHDSIEAGMNADLSADILQAVDDAYLLTKQRLEWVDPARSSTIHRVRIVFKAFRYMVEIVHPLVNDFPVGNLEKMYEYQFLMGEIQDTEVFAQTLADFAEYASVPDVEPVRRYYEGRHSAAVSAYISEMNQLRAFWRAAPDQPYPWEKTQ